MEKLFMNAVEGLRGKSQEIQWEKPEVYAYWVRQTLAMVRHTTRLICLAAAETPLDQREAHYEWIHHLKGETNHDLVAANDLKALGYGEQEIPTHWAAEQIVQNQYYFLRNESPMSLCGYSLLLEGLACHLAPPLISRLEKTYHKNQMQFLRLHALVDQDHFAEGVEFLSKVPNLPIPAITKNLEQTKVLYSAILDEGIRLGQASPLKKTA